MKYFIIAFVFCCQIANSQSNTISVDLQKHYQTIEGWGWQLAPGVRPRVAGRTRHRDQDHARRPAPALGEHPPGRDAEIPSRNKAGLRCEVQRTIDRADETCAAGVFLHALRRVV